MSGGYFNYAQYHLTEIINTLEQVIANNDSTTKDMYGDTIGRNYSHETLVELKAATILLEIAKTYADQIDLLLSGDQSEQGFHESVKRLLT